MAEILIVDDQDRYAELCHKVMPEHRYLGPVRNWRDLEALLKKKRGQVDLALLDVHMDIPTEDLLGLPDDPDARSLERARREQGVHILSRLRERHPDLPVILMTSRKDLPLERAAEELQAEEYTYFLDNEVVDARALRAQVDGILKARRGLVSEGPIYWGRAANMRRIRSRLLTLARGRLPVILEGATGTGKTLLARHLVHRRSRRKGRFVVVDLSTLPADLMAAHLFGSVRGSYTGSVADRKGAFEEADGGTLLLDEIGNLSEEAQKMLLTVLQEGSVTRIGDVRERKVDVKLVVATNERLADMVAAGRFRRDLFMRLNPACTVQLPPLKDRAPDVQGLVEFCLARAIEGPYLRELVEEYREQHDLPGEKISVVVSDTVPKPVEGCLHLLLPQKSAKLLKAHHWPGNLREFAMTVENAAVFSLAELVGLSGGERPDIIQVRPKLIRDLLRATGPEKAEAPGGGWNLQVAVRPADTLNHVASDVERQYFRALFFQHEGDFRAMAQVLMGDPECARKVQLRFNQLGLKVRDLKQQMS